MAKYQMAIGFSYKFPADMPAEEVHKKLKLYTARAEILRCMNLIMQCMNNEEAYERWIYIFPDEATEDDIAFISQDDACYADCEAAFFRLTKLYGKDGLYLG